MCMTHGSHDSRQEVAIESMGSLVCKQRRRIAPSTSQRRQRRAGRRADQTGGGEFSLIISTSNRMDAVTTGTYHDTAGWEWKNGS